MKFTLEKSYEFGWEGLKGKAYNSKKQFPNASAAYFEVTGKHGKVKTTSSDRIYYILEGEGTFYIDDEEVSVQATDVIIVPKNTSYDYEAKEGVLKMFLVHSPAYTPEHDVKLD